ncbi:MAG: glucose-fructose oxidoreductase [Luteitalea sp.]|nr:glucose-fructose oxidoreductase [Luteitalea sp.]
MSNAPWERLSRRKFLEASGAGLVTSRLAVPTVRAQGPGEPSGRKIRYALVGLGRLAIGQLMPAFASCKHSTLAAFVSGDRDKALKYAAEYGVDPKNIYNYDNYDTIRDNPEVDVIYIVLPNFMHAEYTIRGAQAGKHILCEKPMANTPDDCREMIATCRKANRKLMIGYRLHYEPYTQRLIELAQGGVGQLKVVDASAAFNIGDPNQWRLRRKEAGGGSLMDIGIYALQAARYLTGEEPSEVNAMEYSTAGDPRFKEVEETINFQLRFPSGVLANCVSSYGVSYNRFRAIGDEGWAELEPASAYHGLHLRVSREKSVDEPELPAIDQFAAEMDHFSECILNDTEPKTPGDEGLRDLVAMMAIYEAAKAQKTVTLAA